MSELMLTDGEIEALTGYKIATKQLQVLKNRGFHRAYINRAGVVVVERAHYEAVVRGEQLEQNGRPAKAANLSFLTRKAA